MEKNDIKDTNDFENLTPEEKEQLIQKKKKLFMKRVIIAAVVLLVVIPAISLALKIRKEVIQDRVRFKSSTSTEAPVVIVREEEKISDLDYSNTNLQISLRYPNTALLTDSYDTALGEGKVEIKYSKDDDPNFVQGWTVTVTIFSTKIRDLNQFASTRLTAMKEMCPDNATYSQVTEGKMGSYDSINYSIDYCNGYYRNYYISFGGKFFEVSRYYKGDVGYRQQYETETVAISNSIQFLPQSFEVTEFLKGVRDEESGISFEYPNYLVNTCSIPLPTDEKYRAILSMCEEENPEYGVVISVLNLDRDRTFESLMETEKSKMYDDYFAAKGFPPDGKEETIDLNGVPAIKLSNYHWKDTYYIYAPKNTERGAAALVVGIKETAQLENTISSIIDSIKFE